MTSTESKAAAPASPEAALQKLLKAGIEGSLAYLRKVDPDAAADLDQLRRREVAKPRIVVVGETKRGKSSLTNMLIGVPNLSPVDAAVATASYLEFKYDKTHGARAYVRSEERRVGKEGGR